MANEKRLELIDRKELVKTMCRACNNECCEDPCETGECFMYDAINNAPTVDAVPVVHGRWIMRGGIFRCSECDSKALLKLDSNVGGCREYTHFRSDYCHSCGADMKERSGQE